MGKIYTIVNQKGGVGKTTTSINLGAYLGYFGQRVLLVDLDPQANATSCLGVDRHQIQNGVYEVLIGEKPVHDPILHNSRFKISLLPSSPNLSGAEIEMIDLPDREKRLRSVILPLKDRYDFLDGFVAPHSCDTIERMYHIWHSNKPSTMLPKFQSIRGISRLFSWQMDLTFIS